MPNRTASLTSTMLASVLAGVVLTGASEMAAGAVDNCLRAPKDETPAGRHWRYRIDHATQRQCWYLGDEKGGAARAAPRETATSEDADATSKPAATQRSVADARAELPWPTPRVEQPTVKQPAPVATSDAAVAVNNVTASAARNDDRLSVVATRWPDVSTVTPSANLAPIKVAEANPSDAAATSPPAVAPTVTLIAADAPSGKPAESMLKLLTVAVGALSVAGVLGSAVFRIGSRKRKSKHRQRRDIWGDRDKVRTSMAANTPPFPAHPQAANDAGRSDHRGRNAPPQRTQGEQRRNQRSAAR
jgi:hypothetical protein